MSYLPDNWSPHGRRITDRRPDMFDDLEDDETESSRIWTIVIIFTLSALVGTGFLAALIWAFFQIGGGS